LAVIAGAPSLSDIEEYGLNKKEWLETFLELPSDLPSPDNFRRVFEKINPKEFEQCFQRWVQSLVCMVKQTPFGFGTNKGQFQIK
jgi:hypothetical protein